MVSLSPSYMDLKISKEATMVLNKMLKMVSNGHLINSYCNNKKITTFKSLYEYLECSKTVFYKVKNELENLRIIKCMLSKDSIIILFNPTYIRCGKMNELTFTEFEYEIKTYNYIEWLFFKKEYSESGILKLTLTE